MAQLNEKETVDEVVQEVRAIKEELAKSLDFDIDRILEVARQNQQQSGRTVVAPPAPQKS